MWPNLKCYTGYYNEMIPMFLFAQFFCIAKAMSLITVLWTRLHPRATLRVNRPVRLFS